MAEQIFTETGGSEWRPILKTIKEKALEWTNKKGSKLIATFISLIFMYLAMKQKINQCATVTSLRPSVHKKRQITQSAQRISLGTL